MKLKVHCGLFYTASSSAVEQCFYEWVPVLLLSCVCGQRCGSHDTQPGSDFIFSNDQHLFLCTCFFKKCSFVPKKATTQSEVTPPKKICLIPPDHQLCSFHSIFFKSRNPCSKYKHTVTFSVYQVDHEIFGTPIVLYCRATLYCENQQAKVRMMKLFSSF